MEKHKQLAFPVEIYKAVNHIVNTFLWQGNCLWKFTHSTQHLLTLCERKAHLYFPFHYILKANNKKITKTQNYVLKVLQVLKPSVCQTQVSDYLLRNFQICSTDIIKLQTIFLTYRPGF